MALQKAIQMGVFGVFTLLVLGACSQSPNIRPVTLREVLQEMSPEFETVAYSHDQRIAQQARAIDTNLRGLNDDVDRFLLIDRPLRMSMYPIP